jgi:hypothetical protein
MKHKVGLSCTPSKIIKHEVIEVTEYLVSYGGGMGGSNARFYSKKLINPKKVDSIGVELYNGEVLTIHKNFIVTERKKRILKIVSDITKHVNYHKHVCDSKHEVTYYKLNFGDDFELVNEYVSSPKLDVIERYTY